LKNDFSSASENCWLKRPHFEALPLITSNARGLPQPLGSIGSTTLKAYKYLPDLKAALAAHQSKYVSSD